MRSAAAAALVLVLVSACSFGEAPAPGVERPNIVLIIGDDHGYPDFGFMGSPYVETPHLDRLAEEGTVFTHGFNSASLCQPSLRTLLTGFYPHQFAARRRVLRRLRVRRDPHEWIAAFATLPRQLAMRGYASFQAGKHWEGSYASAGFTDGMLKPGQSRVHGGEGRWLGRRASLDPVYEFIDAQADQPFLVWLAPMLPHVPHNASKEQRRRYMDRGLSSAAIGYYANITRFDDLVGELISHLEQRGLRERTLVVYLADNGWQQGPHEDMLRTLGGDRGKGSLHEMGVRTPIVFSWPGVVPGGVVSDALVSTVDLFPTLLDYAGAPQRSERPGRSLWPLIQEGKGWERERVIGLRVYRRRAEDPAPELEEPLAEFEEFPGELEEPATGFEELSEELDEPTAEAGPSQARRSRRLVRERSYFLRDRDWWYIWHETRGVDQLYDAGRDPRAEHDLAAEHPELVGRLREQVREWEGDSLLFLKPRRKRLRDEGAKSGP
jgi:uncharacterized sulfatase